MGKLFTKSTFWYLIAACIAICMLSVPLAVKPYLVDKGPTWLGLDASWQMMLNYASARHWLFGKDIIYTYGPLGYLSTRYGFGVPLWQFICFDLLVVVNFFFVFKDFIFSSFSRVLGVFTIFCISLLVNRFYGSDTSWVLLFFLYYWFYKSYTNPKTIYFVMIGLLLVLSFYIKQNTWLLGSIAFTAHLVNLHIAKKIKAGYGIGIFVIVAVVFVVSSVFFHISIEGYIKNSFEIIKGYNDIMYLDEDHPGLQTGVYTLLYALLWLFIIQAVVLVKGKNYTMLFFPVISILYVLLVSKQATLRGDVQHLSEFFCCAPLMLITGSIFFGRSEFIQSAQVIIFIVVAGALILMNDTRQVGKALQDRYMAPREYIREMHDYSSAQHLDQKEKRVIPERLLNTIGTAPIDIFPWDCEYLIENKLNYTPRPVFQSFTAYTAPLEKVNYDFYQSKGPRFVIYDYDAIDGRYPFNDECLVNLFLVKNYSVADTFTGNERWRVLLQKKEKTEPLIFTDDKEDHLNIADEVPVRGFSFLKINVAYNLAGKINAFFFKPPQLKIMFLKAGGEWATYRTSPELLKGGVYVGRFINDNRDFVRLLSLNDSLPEIKRVKLSFDSSCFSPGMTVEYFNVK